MKRTLSAVCARALLVVMAAAIFALQLPLEANAAQISAIIVPEFDRGEGKFTGYKFLEMDYPPGSALANEFAGATERYSFYLNGAENPGAVSGVISAMNRNLNGIASGMQVTSLSLQYTATVKGAEDRVEAALKVDLMPSFSKVIIGGNSTKPNSHFVLDADWRGLQISEPVYVIFQNGTRVDINSPAQALGFRHPQALARIASSESARQLLYSPVLDFGDIGRMDLNKWDSLFDPTKSQVSAAGLSSDVNTGSAKVISVYSLGQCSLKQGCPGDQQSTVNVTVNDIPVTLRLITPQPNAQIQIAGYASVQDLQGAQVFDVSLKDAAPQPNGSFPMQVLLVFGGLMGAIAAFVLIKARR